MSRLQFLVLVLAPIAGLAACSSETLSTKGQTISCTTSSGTGVILLCQPVDTGPGGSVAPPTPGETGGGDGHEGGDDGSGSGSGIGSGSGSGSCIDVDEDGDGWPHDEGVPVLKSKPGDMDGDGIPDDQDCDNHQGEDDNRGADLPYDVKPQLGTTATPVVDAFTQGGGTAPTILTVAMPDGGSWRLTELQASTPFVITQADCDHQGNRDVGRDRVFVTWQNPNGSTDTDHLDIRYCDQ